MLIKVVCGYLFLVNVVNGSDFTLQLRSLLYIFIKERNKFDSEVNEWSKFLRQKRAFNL